MRNKIVFWHREAKVAVLQDALVIDQNVLKLDVHMRELSLVVHLLEALNQLEADRPHQVVIAHNHSLTLAICKTFCILTVNVLVDKVEQVAVLTILEYQVVANTYLAINDNWLLTFKCINFDDIGAGPKHLTHSVLVLGVVHHVLVNVFFKDLNADLPAVAISCQEDLGLKPITDLLDSFNQSFVGPL